MPSDIIELTNLSAWKMLKLWNCGWQWRTKGEGFEGFNPPPPKFRRPSKIVPNSTRLWKLLKIAEFRTPTHQDVQKKCSKILKLPSVRNCFTLAMTNKLVFIINSLKVSKIKKILLYEIKFLVPNYSCLQNLWLGGYCPQVSVLNWICWTPPWTKFLGTPPVGGEKLQWNSKRQTFKPKTQNHLAGFVLSPFCGTFKCKFEIHTLAVSFEVTLFHHLASKKFRSWTQGLCQEVPWTML